MNIKRCLNAPVKLKRSKNIIKKCNNDKFINIDVTYDELLLIKNAIASIINNNINDIQDLEIIQDLNKRIETLLENYQ